MSARHVEDENHETAAEDRDARLDEALEMTFPASDPVALSRSEDVAGASPKTSDQGKTRARGGKVR